MPLDAICLSALAGELSSVLDGARIDKIYQTGKSEIQLAMRTKGGSVRLLLSAGAQNPRMHLTSISRENPSVPPMFCMLLRKHLTGARFVGLFQPSLERVLLLDFDVANEMGEIVRKQLVCEIMGRHSNIVLVDSQGRILDAVCRVDSDMSEKRQVLPGLFYRLPPPQEKLNPIVLSKEQILQYWIERPEGKSEYDWLLGFFQGLSPLICRELIYRGLPDSLFELCNIVNNRQFVPVMLCEKSEPKDFSFFDIKQYSQSGLLTQDLSFSSFSELLDNFYTRRDINAQMKQKSQNLMKHAVNQKERILRKLSIQQSEWEQTLNRERYREQGDLLMANLHLIKTGQTSVSVVDFYHPEQAETVIKLDQKKTPQQNAAKYYKDYAKAKNAQKLLEQQMEMGRQDLVYWESVIEEITRAGTEKELQEIRDEVMPPKKTSKPLKTQSPAQFMSTEGIRFYAGRNNRQNDQLTLKMASNNDIWMHTKKIPGCHVVIEAYPESPGEQTLYEAAVVAAFYSQAKTSPKVEVDYTLIKYVKKPSGAKPGMVIYDKFKTLLVSPNEETVKKLKIRD